MPDIELSETERQELLNFVRGTIAAELDGAALPEPPALPLLAEQLSCFVTLSDRATGELRGCIGNLEAFEPLRDNLRRNAVNAAFHDPRFPPLEPEELPGTAIEISILSAPTRIAAPEAFLVGRHGIILEHAGRHAVFLPQVAPEQGWDRETTLDYLARKAGLPPGAWRDPAAKLAVFSAEIIG